MQDISSFLNTIEKIIEEECQNINIKITGVNYLEILKFNLIPKISTYLDNKPFISDENIEKKMLISSNEIELNCVVINNKKSFSALKRIINMNSLFISFGGNLNIDILENSTLENFKQINLYPFMGICLSSETVINLNSFQNSFFIEIIKNENNIENSKKDII